MTTCSESIYKISKGALSCFFSCYQVC